MSSQQTEKKPRRFSTPYTHQAVEWILVVLVAGVVAAILGVAAAMVYWAWTA